MPKITLYIDGDALTETILDEINRSIDNMKAGDSLPIIVDVDWMRPNHFTERVS